VITGGGLRYAIEAQAAGAEVFITGETSHAWYHPVVETGIPSLCYGHYRTETGGLRRLEKRLVEELGLETGFIETPTGM
jgi:putative NIF3 family GTP cyclohydrolase 1 type 2